MSSKTPPAGWYADPQMPKTKRYWDGEVWTDQRQEEPPPVPVATWKIVASVLVALVLPIIGLIIGIAMWSRARTPAIVVLGVTVLSTFYWVIALPR